MLDRQPRTILVYLRHGELQRDQDCAASAAELAEAEAMVREVCADPEVELPQAAVLDVGVIAGRGWAVVEQNAASGTGTYACDPSAMLEVLRHAAEPVGIGLPYGIRETSKAGRPSPRVRNAFAHAQILNHRVRVDAGESRMGSRISDQV